MRSIAVRDCMTPQVITFSPDTEVIEAIRLLLKHNITAAPIISDSGEVLGLLSESDCLKAALLSGYHCQEGGLVTEQMTSNVMVASPDDDIISAYQHFMKEHAFRVPVLEEGVLVGMLSR